MANVAALEKKLEEARARQAENETEYTGSYAELQTALAATQEADGPDHLKTAREAFNRYVKANKAYHGVPTRSGVRKKKGDDAGE